LAKCSGITQAGTACKGIPIDGSQWCYVHHPDHVEERRRHGSRGGKRGGRARPQSDLQDVKHRLRRLAEDVLTGAVDKGVGAVVATIWGVYLRAVSTELAVKEQEELVGRLEALEEDINARRTLREEEHQWHA
jgi:hypothetical protein